MELFNSGAAAIGRSLETEIAKLEIQLDAEVFNKEKEVRRNLTTHYGKEVESRGLQKFWRGVEDKRDRLQQFVELHEVLVRIAFIMGLVSLTVYINLAPAELDEFETNSVLMAIWGGISVVCSIVHTVVLLLSRCLPHAPLYVRHEQGARL